jgi:beta-glucosidase
MQNVYLPPFRAGVEAGAGTVMSAYMDLNDVATAGMCTSVGSLVTQGFAKDATDAAFRGATAGVNMDMGSATYLAHMKSLLDQGKLTPTQLDDLVRPRWALVSRYHLSAGRC